jgi:hypothetical protein
MEIALMIMPEGLAKQRVLFKMVEGSVNNFYNYIRH